MRWRYLSLGILIVAFLGRTASAGSLTYMGNTAGGPTWNRPVEGEPPTELSTVGTAVPYSVTCIMVDFSNPYTFKSTATNPVNWDNFLALYQGSFNPNRPLDNVLVTNDDNPTVGMAGFTIALAAGTHYFVVTTGFANTDAGAFTNTISDQMGGTITVCPEPPSLVSAGTAVLVGLLYAWRRRRTAHAA
jgi:hypothetical protein